MTGLTSEQCTRLSQSRCEVGHRFDAVNYPTPEGNCPRCICPEIEEDISRFHQLTIEMPTVERGFVHPSLLTHA